MNITMRAPGDMSFPSAPWGCDGDTPRTPICGATIVQNWIGVTCGDINSTTGIVTSQNGCNNAITIELAYIPGLTGTISSLIGELTLLNHLSIAHAPLTGTIPTEVGLLTHLVELNIMDTVPLTQADINAHPDWTGIIGSIPYTIDSLCLLQVLRFENNALGGNIPESMCYMSNIGSVSFYNNYLVGNVPSAVCCWHLVTFLDFSGNDLHCQPDCLMNAPSYGGVYPINVPTDAIPNKCTSCQDTHQHWSDINTTLSNLKSHATLNLSGYCSGT
jgi:hypothetical protein